MTSLRTFKAIAWRSAQGASGTNSQRGCFPDDSEDRRLHHLHPAEPSDGSNLPCHQASTWLKLLKTTRHDLDSLEVRSCSFHDSRGNATMHCCVLKWHLKDLVRQGHLKKFILNLEEDPEVREAQLKWSAETLASKHHPGQENHHRAMCFPPKRHHV